MAAAFPCCIANCNSLPQVVGRKGLQGGVCDAATEVLDEGAGLWAENTMATGRKQWLASKWAYLAFFLLPASAATAPASLLARSLYEGTRVSGHVASHTNTLPPFHGTMDAPPGLLPSVLYRPVGSSGSRSMLYVRRALLMISLRAAWRGWRPLLCRQLRP